MSTKKSTLATQSDKTFIEQAKESVKDAAQVASQAATDAIGSITNAAKDAAQKVSDSVEARRGNERLFEAAHAQRIEVALEVGLARVCIDALGESPVKLSAIREKQIHSLFPIPREQTILWADAEFDLRPSGVVATECGVFIRTNSTVFNENKKKDSEEKSEDSTKSLLYYYRWDSFEPAWFCDDSERNVVLLVEPQCRERFMSACSELVTREVALKNSVYPGLSVDDMADSTVTAEVAVVTGAAMESAESAVFVEQRAFRNNTAGHGEMVEEANTMLDRLHGLDAKVVGRDNVKNGPDRLVEEMFVQTKYYNSARGSLEACFDPKSGTYLYMKDGTPMQLEVPKDQYPRVLEGFRRKIAAGKVPGVTDPNEAGNIVREGRLTYREAVNLTKPGTIASLAYDVATGVIICSCAFGLTFVVTVFLAWRRTGDIRKSVEAGLVAGIQVFGISFFQHMVVSQVARTGLAGYLMAPSQYVVAKLGYQTSATIVNGLRILSGKGAIHGAAAAKSLAKIMRSNVITSTIAFAVFSVPETYNLAVKKISGAQYAKNLTVLTGSIAGGAGGAVAAGIAAAKIAGAIGTTVAPGVGTAVGIVGGFVGGAVGAKVVDAAGDILYEDDSVAFSRLLNSMIACMASEYIFDAVEMDTLISKINKTEGKQFKKLMDSTWQAAEQETVLRNFLSPLFDEIAAGRAQFSLPDEQVFTDVLAEVFDASAGSVAEV